MKNQKKEGSFYTAKVCMSPGIRIEGCIPCFGRLHMNRPLVGTQRAA